MSERLVSYAWCLVQFEFVKCFAAAEFLFARREWRAKSLEAWRLPRRPPSGILNTKRLRETHPLPLDLIELKDNKRVRILDVITEEIFKMPRIGGRSGFYIVLPNLTHGITLAWLCFVTDKSAIGFICLLHVVRK
jgi:hypothetical protein